MCDDGARADSEPESEQDEESEEVGRGHGLGVRGTIFKWRFVVIVARLGAGGGQLVSFS